MQIKSERFQVAKTLSWKECSSKLLWQMTVKAVVFSCVREKNDFYLSTTEVTRYTRYTNITKSNNICLIWWLQRFNKLLHIKHRAQGLTSSECVKCQSSSSSWIIHQAESQKVSTMVDMMIESPGFGVNYTCLQISTPLFLHMWPSSS